MLVLSRYPRFSCSTVVLGLTSSDAQIAYQLQAPSLPASDHCPCGLALHPFQSYAPYVDALFVDKRCAALLKEEPLGIELEYKARIFSLSDPDEFLGYLQEIKGNTPDDVREYAAMIYSID